MGHVTINAYMCDFAMHTVIEFIVAKVNEMNHCIEIGAAKYYKTWLSCSGP